MHRCEAYVEDLEELVGEGAIDEGDEEETASRHRQQSGKEEVVLVR